MPVAPTSGGGGTAGDVRAGGAYVEISARDRLSATMSALRAKTKAFAAGLSAIGRNVTFVGAATFAPLSVFFRQGVGRAEEAGKLAEQLGFSVTQMQRLKYAADVAGVSVEAVLSKPEKYADLMSAAPVLSAAAVQDATAASRSFRAALIDLQTALAPLVAALVPTIRAVTEFVRRNPELARGLFVVAAAAATVGPALMFVGGVAIPLVTTAAGGLIAVLTGVVGKVLAVGGALGHLGTQVFPETSKAAVKSFGELLSIATGTVGGIVTAIGQGDIPLAMELVTAGALAAWKKLAADMTYVWVSLKNTIVDTFREAAAGVRMIFTDLGAWLLRNDFTGLLRGDLTDAEINAGRDAVNDQEYQEVKRLQREAREFRSAQIQAANAEAAAARAKLNELLGRVQAGATAARAADDEPLSRRITATRSAFRLLADANQQFGGSDRVPTEQLIELKKIRQTLSMIEKYQLDMSLANRFQ